jgi:hypothetical protein
VPVSESPPARLADANAIMRPAADATTGVIEMSPSATPRHVDDGLPVSVGAL